MIQVEVEDNLEYLYQATPIALFGLGSPYTIDEGLEDEEYLAIGDLYGDYIYDESVMQYVPTNKYYIRQYSISNDFKELTYDDFLVDLNSVCVQLL